MTDRRNELLLAALMRAGEPLDSDDLVRQATELALDYLWTPDHLVGLTRKSVAKRCRDLVESGHLRVQGVGMDGGSRRTTPRYAPVADYDADAPVPIPPSTPPTQALPSPYESMDRTQLFVIMEAQDDVLECLARFMRELKEVNDRQRRKLAAQGLVDFR